MRHETLIVLHGCVIGGYVYLRLLLSHSGKAAAEHVHFSIVTIRPDKTRIILALSFYNSKANLVGSIFYYRIVVNVSSPCRSDLLTRYPSNSCGTDSEHCVRCQTVIAASKTTVYYPKDSRYSLACYAYPVRHVLRFAARIIRMAWFCNLSTRRMYVFICLRRLLCIWQHEADVDLRPVNNTQWAETRPQHRELRALLFSISVWVL